MAGALYFLFTRPDVYYTEDRMFITNRAGELSIALENIRSIKLSVWGFQKNGGSWIVQYADGNVAIKKIRIYPSIFSNPFSKFIKAVQNKNRDVQIRTWAIG